MTECNGYDKLITRLGNIHSRVNWIIVSNLLFLG